MNRQAGSMSLRRAKRHGPDDITPVHFAERAILCAESVLQHSPGLFDEIGLPWEDLSSFNRDSEEIAENTQVAGFASHRGGLAPDGCVCPDMFSAIFVEERVARRTRAPLRPFLRVAVKQYECAQCVQNGPGSKNAWCSNSTPLPCSPMNCVKNNRNTYSKSSGTRPERVSQRRVQWARRSRVAAR